MNHLDLEKELDMKVDMVDLAHKLWGMPKRMTHAEAVEEMKRLANGRPWSLDYRTASYLNGSQIHGYIAVGGLRGHAQDATTYAGAIRNVRIMLGLETEAVDPPPEDGA